MLLLKNLRISKNLTKHHIAKRYLCDLPQSATELNQLPATRNVHEDNINSAQKELSDLTGGLTLDELRKILQPQKYSHLNIETNPDEVQLTKENSKGGLLPTYNLAAYVDKSELLQQFIQMGVDLSAIEKRKGGLPLVLRLQQDNVKAHLLFLKNQGVPDESFGEIVTKNPFIFNIQLDNMQTRVNYLESKRFRPIQIQRILTINPYWLMFSTKRIDRRLGYFQKEFQLKGDDVRSLATKQPRLITYNMEHIRFATFSIREEMGFNKNEVKSLLLSKPRLWMLKFDDLIERFAYAHQEMKLPHKIILQQPEVLTSREYRLRERHEFLKMLGRDQYDPAKDMYISPKSLVGDINFFLQNVAKSDLETYELFLKTR